MAFSLPSSSSSSSSPSPPRWSHDVFLSFRGIDTRNTFTAHLYHALCQRGIKTYKDDEDLQRGETISPTLLKAIEESMTSIIVLSQNYASSTWCLEELTKILECKKTKQQIVLPVFYHIHPSEVRNLRGSFGEALAKHQERFKEDPKVQRWKEALQEVAGLAGEHLEDGNEYEFMQKIIQWVDSTIAKSKCQLDIAEYPIGLKSRLKDLNTNLGIGRNDITLMTGIYGTGGIGKTTTAKAIFNSIGHQFEARCFLANVRENSSREDGLVKLQEKLLCELLGNSKSFTIGSVGGTNVIKNRLHSKRVLLILDDVNELRQLKELAGNKNWFGRGSRIVITTRDQRLLAYHQVDSTYEVQGLDDNQAIQLFSWHAFERDNPVESYVELTKAIIVYAKGLPLALIVLGSYLRDRSIQEWKSALEKYERSPHKDIYEILKISYDGLDNNEKDIFLDIACFFKGNSVEYVMKILDSCGFSSTIGIARLKEKCLINIQYHQWVEMHDLLQEMGKEIVRQESPKEAGKRRRLFFHEDVRQVLEENTGIDKIEGILLDFPEGHDDKLICLHPKAFKKMRNLRLFINRNAQFSGGPSNYLSNEIRVFDWPEYPWSFLPSKFRGNNLVKFQMPNSLVKEFGGLKCKNLTYMNLSGCKSLTKIPDLSSCPNLEWLYLSYCENLVEIHDSVELRMPNSLITFKNLTYMNLSGCKSLTKIPNLSSCPNLEMLDLRNCENLVEVHDSVKLQMPNSLITFKNLTYMFLSGCKSLTKIPDLSSCPNLRWLDLSNCENLVEVHDSVKLRMPNSLITFKNLTSMNLSGCKSLTKILALSSCPNLENLDLSHCTSLESFALLSEILIKNNGANFFYFLRIDLSGCHKLLANMRPIPSWEEEQNWAEPLKRERDIGIIFPGKRIPNWFSYRNEAHDSILFQIDIKPPHHCYGILLYVVFGFRVGIIDPITDDGYTPVVISVEIHYGSDKKELSIQVMTDSWMDSDHVWMYGQCYRPDKQTVSRVTFKCKSELLVFRRIGIHFVRLGSKFHCYSSDKEIDSSQDLMDEKRHSSISELDNDDENPKEDLELENDDENLKEIFGKRRRHDEYDCNLELNLYPQQKRQHSSTMGIIITELENDDENL